MRAHTDYLWFDTKKRHELVNITDRVAEIVAASKVREGLCLVSAMHITAGIWVNDEESGLKHDVMEWLERLAPAGDYRHHQTGEDNADAHLKRTVVHHQVVLPVTAAPSPSCSATSSRCTAPRATWTHAVRPGRSACSTRWPAPRRAA